MKSNTNQKKTTGRSEEIRATFTVRELAEYVGISEVMAYRLLSNGEIPHRRAGKRFIVPREAIDEWLRTAPAKRSRRAS